MTEPMRVLHLHSGNMFGGVESQLTALAALRDHCPEMESTFALCYEGRLGRELRAAGARVHRLGMPRFRWPWTIWQSRRSLRWLLTRSRFDAAVCHSCWSLAIFARTAKRSGVPLVYWAHDIPNGNHWLEQKAKRTEPDLILANSRATLSSMPLLFPAGRAEFQPALIRLGKVANPEAIRLRIRGELATPMNAVVILMACRMERLKGHRVLLEALSNLTDLPEWRCWIAGGMQRRSDKTYFDELTRQVQITGLTSRVRFLGQRNDVPDLMAAADIYCQPNIEPESFGLTFVEAMQAGLPVVTSAIGGATEIVDDTCGRLLTPGDPAALSAVLAQLIRDGQLRLTLGQTGRTRAAVNFDGDAAICRLYGHLAALCGKYQSSNTNEAHCNRR